MPTCAQSGRRPRRSGDARDSRQPGAVSHVDLLYAWAVIVGLLGVVGWLLCRLWLCVQRRDAIEERRR